MFFLYFQSYFPHPYKQENYCSEHLIPTFLYRRLEDISASIFGIKPVLKSLQWTPRSIIHCWFWTLRKHSTFGHGVYRKQTNTNMSTFTQSLSPSVKARVFPSALVRCTICSLGNVNEAKRPIRETSAYNDYSTTDIHLSFTAKNTSVTNLSGWPHSIHVDHLGQ
jgi:hypothetical protein